MPTDGTYFVSPLHAVKAHTFLFGIIFIIPHATKLGIMFLTGPSVSPSVIIIFVNVFSETSDGRVLKFCLQPQLVVPYHGIRFRPYPASTSCFTTLPFFRP